ncbi:hypothetical protein KCP69_04585 [Salmonella enterica subsp. enterica]|nr:hypothetical protein KCP69_04585 [Salmonella enterica subsp. enterica]
MRGHRPAADTRGACPLLFLPPPPELNREVSRFVVVSTRRRARAATGPCRRWRRLADYAGMYNNGPGVIHQQMRKIIPKLRQNGTSRFRCNALYPLPEEILPTLGHAQSR